MTKKDADRGRKRMGPIRALLQSATSGLSSKGEDGGLDGSSKAGME